MILKWPENRVGEDVIGLAVNLAANPDLADQLLTDANGTASSLVERFLRTKDPLLLKMLHNCTHSETCQQLLVPHVEKFVSLALNAPKELIIDIMGILANMESVQIDWAGLAKRFSLMDFLSRVMQQYRKDDSVMTEVIALLGTVVGDRQVASTAAREDIVSPLIEMVPEKKDNEPLLIQLLHTLYKLVLYKDTRKILLTPRRPSPESYAVHNKLFSCRLREHAARLLHHEERNCEDHCLHDARLDLCALESVRPIPRAHCRLLSGMRPEAGRHDSHKEVRNVQQPVAPGSPNA
jgi:hypothetical protein